MPALGRSSLRTGGSASGGEDHPGGLRGLLGEPFRIAYAFPGGMEELAKKAVGQMSGPTRALIDFSTGREGGPSALDVGSSFLSAGFGPPMETDPEARQRYAERYQPLEVEFGRSFARTGTKVANAAVSLAPGGLKPSETKYVQAYKEGELLGNILEDAANLSIVAEVGSGGLTGAAGVIAARAGGEVTTESIAHAAARGAGRGALRAFVGEGGEQAAKDAAEQRLGRKVVGQARRLFQADAREGTPLAAQQAAERGAIELGEAAGPGNLGGHAGIPEAIPVEGPGIVQPTEPVQGPRLPPGVEDVPVGGGPRVQPRFPGDERLNVPPVPPGGDVPLRIGPFTRTPAEWMRTAGRLEDYGQIGHQWARLGETIADTPAAPYRYGFRLAKFVDRSAAEAGARLGDRLSEKLDLPERSRMEEGGGHPVARTIYGAADRAQNLEARLGDMRDAIGRGAERQRMGSKLFEQRDRKIVEEGGRLIAAGDAAERAAGVEGRRSWVQRLTGDRVGQRLYEADPEMAEAAYATVEGTPEMMRVITDEPGRLEAYAQAHDISLDEARDRLVEGGMGEEISPRARLIADQYARGELDAEQSARLERAQEVIRDRIVGPHERKYLSGEGDNTPATTRRLQFRWENRGNKPLTEVINDAEQRWTSRIQQHARAVVEARRRLDVAERRRLLNDGQYRAPVQRSVRAIYDEASRVAGEMVNEAPERVAEALGRTPDTDPTVLHTELANQLAAGRTLPRLEDQIGALGDQLEAMGVEGFGLPSTAKLNPTERMGERAGRAAEAELGAQRATENVGRVDPVRRLEVDASRYGFTPEMVEQANATLRGDPALNARARAAQQRARETRGEAAPLDPGPGVFRPVEQGARRVGDAAEVAQRQSEVAGRAREQLRRSYEGEPGRALDEADARVERAVEPADVPETVAEAGRQVQATRETVADAVEGPVGQAISADWDTYFPEGHQLSYIPPPRRYRDPATGRIEYRRSSGGEWDWFYGLSEDMQQRIRRDYMVGPNDLERGLAPDELADAYQRSTQSTESLGRGHTQYDAPTEWHEEFVRLAEEEQAAKRLTARDGRGATRGARATEADIERLRYRLEGEGVDVDEAGAVYSHRSRKAAAEALIEHRREMGADQAEAARTILEPADEAAQREATQRLDELEANGAGVDDAWQVFDRDEYDALVRLGINEPGNPEWWEAAVRRSRGERILFGRERLADLKSELAQWDGREVPPESREYVDWLRDEVARTDPQPAAQRELNRTEARVLDAWLDRDPERLENNRERAIYNKLERDQRLVDAGATLDERRKAAAAALTERGYRKGYREGRDVGRGAGRAEEARAGEGRATRRAEATARQAEGPRPALPEEQRRYRANSQVLAGALASPIKTARRVGERESIYRERLRTAETAERRLATDIEGREEAKRKAAESPTAVPARYAGPSRAVGNVRRMLEEEAKQLDAEHPGSGDVLRNLVPEVEQSIDSMARKMRVEPEAIRGAIEGDSTYSRGRNQPPLSPRTARSRKTSNQRQKVRTHGDTNYTIRNQIIQEMKLAEDQAKNSAAQWFAGEYGTTAIDHLRKQADNDPEVLEALAPGAEQPVLDEYGKPIEGSRKLRGKELTAIMEDEGFVAFDPRMLHQRPPAGNATIDGTIWVPQHLEEAFANRVSKQPSWAQAQIMRYWDRKVMQGVRTAWLALSPGWLTGNIVGNAILGTVAGGVNPLMLPSRMREANDLRKAGGAPGERVADAWAARDPERLTNRSERRLYSRLDGEMRRRHGLESEAAVDAMRGTFDARLDPRTRLNPLDAADESTRRRAANDALQTMQLPRQLSHRGFTEREHEFMLHEHQLDIGAVDPTSFEKLRRASHASDLVNWSYDFNQFVDELSRGAVYLDKRAKGMASRDAIRSALFAAGDFQKLTPFERNVMRRFFPFYTWSRHITQLVFRLPVYHPWRVMWTLHLSEMFGDDEHQGNLPPQLRGSLTLPGGDLLPVNRFNPFGDLGRNPLLSLRGALSNMNPAINWTLAIGAGLDISNPEGITMSRAPGSGDATWWGQDTATGLWKDPKALIRYMVGEFPQGRLVQGLRDSNRVKYDSGQPVITASGPLTREGMSPRGARTQAVTRYLTGVPLTGLKPPRGIPQSAVATMQRDRARNLSIRQRANARYERRLQSYG